MRSDPPNCGQSPTTRWGQAPTIPGSPRHTPRCSQLHYPSAHAPHHLLGTDSTIGENAPQIGGGHVKRALVGHRPHIRGGHVPHQHIGHCNYHNCGHGPHPHSGSQYPQWLGNVPIGGLGLFKYGGVALPKGRSGECEYRLGGDCILRGWALYSKWLGILSTGWAETVPNVTTAWLGIVTTACWDCSHHVGGTVPTTMVGTVLTSGWGIYSSGGWVL